MLEQSGATENLNTNKEEIQTGSKGKLIGIVIGILVVIIAGIIIGVVVIKKKKETPKTEAEKYREQIENKIRGCYTKEPVNEKTNFILMLGSFIEMNDKYLKAFNDARKNACEEGLIDPKTKKKLAPADYVELKWSTELERIARIRASETSVQNSKDKRPNGENIFEINYSGVNATSEVLGLMSTIEPELLYEKIEKQYKKYKEDSNTTEAEEYKKIIETGNYYIGIAYFDAKTEIEGTNIAIEFSNLTDIQSSNLNGNTYLKGDFEIYQTIDVFKVNLGEYKIEGLINMNVKDVQFLEAKVNMTTSYESYPNIHAWPYKFHYYEFTSDNYSCVNVTEYGKAEAKATGIAIISIANEKKEKISSSLAITVECNHDFEYSYFKEEGVFKGLRVCKLCGDKKTFTPPNSLVITWRNNETSPEEFNTTVPESNPIGSQIEGKYQKDGDAEFSDIIAEFSEEGFIDSTLFEEGFEFGVLKKGKVNVTFYPKFNVNYTQTFELPLGN